MVKNVKKCCCWNAVTVCVLSKGRLKKGLVKRNTPSFFFVVGVVSVTIQQQLVDLTLAGQANLHFSSYVISRWCVVCVWFSSVKVTPASNGTEVTSVGKFICSLIWCSCAAHLQADVRSARFPGECLFGFSSTRPSACPRVCRLDFKVCVVLLSRCSMIQYSKVTASCLHSFNISLWIGSMESCFPST